MDITIGHFPACDLFYKIENNRGSLNDVTIRIDNRMVQPSTDVSTLNFARWHSMT